MPFLPILPFSKEEVQSPKSGIRVAGSEFWPIREFREALVQWNELQYAILRAVWRFIAGAKREIRRRMGWGPIAREISESRRGSQALGPLGKQEAEVEFGQLMVWWHP